MKNILKTSFWQLIVIYTAIVVALALGFLWKYSLQFHIFAIAVAVIGISIINKKANAGELEEEELERKENGGGRKEEHLNKKLHNVLLISALFIIILFRIIPYFSNSIPLGYDAGLYKYGIEHGLQNLDSWILQGGMEPGFLYLMSIFKIFLSIDFILKYLLIAFCVLLGLGVYFVAKEHFNSKTALIAIFLYAFSLIQFKTFWYMYYKNIIAMSLMLFALYFLKRAENNRKFIWLFVALGGLTGAVHRPTFYIFGLSYFFYAFISPLKKNYEGTKYDFRVLKKNALYGVLVLGISSLFYLGRFSQAITSMFEPVLLGFVQTGEAPGTFINFFTYQFSVLACLPFAFLGLFCFIRNFIKKKEFNILAVWAIINLAVVYFQFFFFNRFIIFLDVALILMASLGFSLLIRDKKKLGTALMIILLLSAGILAFKESINSKPLITEDELNAIKQLQNTEENAFVMATSSIYSPWILGYSNRKTIAPGLFDYNQHNEQEWINFWTTPDINEIKKFMSNYEKPLYLFIGQKQKDNLEQFPACFNQIYKQESNKVYKYIC